MSLKNSQNIESLKHEYIYGSIHADGKRSFKSLDNLIKQYQLAAATIYRRSSKELWKNQRLSFKSELSEEIKKAKKNDIVNDIQFIQNKATNALSLTLDKAIDYLEKEKSINPRGFYNLTQTIIACSKNLPAIAESDEDDNEGFRNAMDLLDQIADFKRL
tara:strand:+ start:101 stop:580 length:480 start_codon:yes stop_codon:yes gene_type:complete